MSRHAVALDVSPLQTADRHRGIGRYVAGLLTGLAELGVDVQTWGFAGVMAREAPPDLGMGPHLRWKGGPEVVAALRRPLPRGLDLFHATSMVAALQRVQTPRVTTVYDPTPLLFPDRYLAPRYRRFEYRRYLTALRRSKRLIAISQDTASRFAAVLERPISDFSVTPLAGTLTATPHQELVSGRFVLCAGTAEAHKNVRFALEVMGRLPAELRVPVVVSGTSWEAGASRQPAAALTQFAASRGVELHQVGLVTDGELLGLYRDAAAVLFPSLFEGFGLPALEAMTVGGAVLASNRGALPETVGGGGVVLPLRTDDWIAALSLHLRGERLVSKERATAWATRYSWRETARRTVQAWNLVGP